MRTTFRSLATLPFAPLSLVPASVHSWSQRCQQGSRRNALVAATELAARRAERESIEVYIAKAVARYEVRSGLQRQARVVGA